MITKTIAILAKSNKAKWWCVAGKEVSMNGNNIISVGNWIRPVSADREHQGAINDNDCTLTTGSVADVFDIVEIDFSGHQPITAQPENWLISGNEWRKVGEFKYGDLQRFQDKPRDLWLEDESYPQFITKAYANNARIDNSLLLIKPENLSIKLLFNNGKRFRVEFNYGGNFYHGISITDPVIKRLFYKKCPSNEGAVVTESIYGEPKFLCVSLGPEWGDDGKHFKFAATIFDDGKIKRKWP